MYNSGLKTIIQILQKKCDLISGKCDIINCEITAAETIKNEVLRSGITPVTFQNVFAQIITNKFYKGMYENPCFRIFLLFLHTNNQLCLYR